MKTKIYKLLSVLLALTLVFSACLCVVNAAVEDGADAPIEEYPPNSYFISAKGKAVAAGTRPEGAGTKENPVKTFSDVTRLIAADGLTANDTAYVYVKSGETVGWMEKSLTNESVTETDTFTNYKCKVIIDSTNPEDLGTVQEYDFMDFAGDTTFKNVKLNVPYMYGAVRLGHYNIVFDEGSVVEIPELYIGPKNAPSNYNKDFNLEIKGQFKTGKFYISSYFGKGNYNGDINIVVNNENAAIPLLVTGFRDDNNFVYNGNINITVIKAKTLSLNTHKGKATFNGGLQLVVDDSVNLPYAVKTNFDKLEIAGGKWYITNAANAEDFIQFSDVAGKFNVKGGTTAYSRQFGGKLVTYKNGTVDLSKAPGAYTISDKSIGELLDDSQKMLYFRCGGGSNHIASFASVVAGETYRFEYSIFTSHFEDSFPTCLVNGDRKVIGDNLKVISQKQVGNYYKIVSEITIPTTYTDSLAFFGVNLSSSSQGVVFDRKVYHVDDKNTNLIRNPQLHEGLDHVTLNFDFWGAVYTDSRGGSGLLEWTNGIAELAVKSYDPEFIDYLIYLANPDDGEWWNPEDYIEEDFDTYADVYGTFKDHEGNPIKGVEFLLVSEDKSYSDKTNSKGKFDFKHIVTGFYDLYYVDGKEKVATDFSSYIGQDDLVTIEVVSDIRDLQAEAELNNQPTDFESVTDGDEVEEIIPTGNFSATVYTPLRDIVTNLKVTLDGIGEVVTDATGSFAFANIPVGSYELYTVLEDGTKYVFRTVVIEENKDVAAKLKYDPAVEIDTNDTADNGWIIWVIVASVVALVIVAGVIFLLVFKKKKA